MNALEISEDYFKLAAKTKDLRWKRQLLETAIAFQAEWFGPKDLKTGGPHVR